MPTLVANGSAQSSDNTNATTGSLNTTGATLLVVVLSGNTSPLASTISDSKGNTWTKGPASAGANPATIYYSTPTSVGSGHTFSIASAASYPSIWALAFSGVKTSSPLDQTNTNSNSASATIATGSITPTKDNCLVIAACCARDFAPPDQAIDASSINSSLTITNHGAADGTPTHMGGGAAYIVQTTAGAVNPTWTTTGGDTVNNTLSAAIASFFPAPVGRMFEVF